MKQSPIISRSRRVDPIHSKMYLSDFSSPVKRSQIDLRKSQGDDEICCQICHKLYKIEAFKEHISHHRRKPQEKIPNLAQIYEENYQKYQEKSSPKQWEYKEVRSININSEERLDSEGSSTLLNICPSAQSLEMTQAEYLSGFFQSSGNLKQ